jgi:hypothetical protein
LRSAPIRSGVKATCHDSLGFSETVAMRRLLLQVVVS